MYFRVTANGIESEFSTGREMAHYIVKLQAIETSYKLEVFTKGVWIEV